VFRLRSGEGELPGDDEGCEYRGDDEKAA